MGVLSGKEEWEKWDSVLDLILSNKMFSTEN